jgi:recombination DNA repair RAD52 pathway protein
MTDVRYVEAKYDTTIMWDIESIAERNNFKIEEIDKIEVGKWVRIFITLKDGTIFQEDGGTGDSTDWKWAEHQGFYDKNWYSIDEEEVNGS